MAYDPNDPRNPTDTLIITDASDLDMGDADPSFTRTGPLLDPDRLKQEYLFGVPMRAVLTGEVISNDTMKRFISNAISDFETSVRVAVRPVRILQKFDFERADDISFGTRQMKRWPVTKVEKLSALWPGRSDGQEYNYPTDWVEMDGDTGLMRIVPRSSTEGSSNGQYISSGYAGIPLVGNFKSWPSLWRVQYIAGFEYDKVPHSVNHLIGILAAIQFLSQMGPAIFPYNSQSIGIDGMSQGTGSPGPQWLAGRIAELTAERDRLVANLRAHYGTDVMLAAF